MSSIAKRNLVDSITRLIPDEFLRNQIIDLHLGKLSEEQIKMIREEKEREAEEILKIPQHYSPSDCVIQSKTIIFGDNPPSYDDEDSSHNINGKPENRND